MAANSKFCKLQFLGIQITEGSFESIGALRPNNTCWMTGYKIMKHNPPNNRARNTDNKILWNLRIRLNCLPCSLAASTKVSLPKVRSAVILMFIVQPSYFKDFC